MVKISYATFRESVEKMHLAGISLGDMGANRELNVHNIPTAKFFDAIERILMQQTTLQPTVELNRLGSYCADR